MKKLLLWVVVLVLSISMIAAFSLSGCKTEKEATEEEEVVVEEAAEEEEAVEEETTSSEKITITYMDFNIYAIEDFDKIFTSYTEENPNVEFEFSHTANDYASVLQTRVSSGQVPDIFVVSTGTEANQYIGDYAYDFTGDAILDLFKPASLLPGTTIDGRVMSLPREFSNHAFIYNKKLFNQAGITELPKTIDELEAVCETLQDAGITPFGIGYKEWWVWAQMYSAWLTHIDPNPNVLIEKISSGDTKFADMEFMEDLFKVVDLTIKYGVAKPLEIGWDQSENMIANDEVAIIHMGDWAEAYLKEANPDIEMGFFPITTGNGPQDAILMAGVPVQMILYKDSPNLEEAKKFLEYMLASDIGIDWVADKYGSISAVISDVEVSGTLANDASKWIDEGYSKPWNFILWPAGFPEKFGEVMQSYVLGESTMEEIVEVLDNSWVELNK